jgi:4-methylaminobutanoate oxidase (formaldehyde-forming)
VRARTVEACAKHYTMAWPHEEAGAGRPRRVSPLYDRLKAAGACFGSKLGWERANWFARPGETPEDIYSFGRQNWFDAVGEEHRACREAAALFDASSFAKYLVAGKDAERALSWICANDVSGPPGKVTYTQMLSDRGGIECDLTVSRLDETTYYIVTGTGFATHDAAWIRRNIPADADATLTEITGDMAVLTLMGPRARDVLGAVAVGDLSNENFPFGTCRQIDIAGHDVRAIRVTYVGELGWELHMPVAAAPDVFDALTAAGEPHGLRLAGYRAIESLRLEKGYRAWGSDIGHDYTPVEAGMAWALKLKKNIDFKGRDAVAAQAANGVAKRLACFTVEDPEIVLLGRETIYRNGQRVGWLSSAGWGYAVATTIGYGYVRNPDGVDARFLDDGSYELEVATELVPAKLHMKPLYDPTNARVKS